MEWENGYGSVIPRKRDKSTERQAFDWNLQGDSIRGRKPRKGPFWRMQENVLKHGEGLRDGLEQVQMAMLHIALCS